MTTLISTVTKKQITMATGKQAVWQERIEEMLSDSELNPDGVQAVDLIQQHKKGCENRELFMQLRDTMADELALGKNGKGLLNNYVNLSCERIANNIVTKAQADA